MAVAARRHPTERACLLLQVADVADLVNPGIRLDAIAVDDHGDLVQAAIRRLLKRLPELPLLELAVAGEDVHASGPAGEAVGEREAPRLRAPMPSEPVLVTTSGVAATSGCPEAVQTPQLVDQVEVEPPERGQHRVEAGSVVALGREVPVSSPSTLR